LSQGWNFQENIFVNLLFVMNLRLFLIDNGACGLYGTSCEYYIDFHTKYIVLFFIAILLYGLCVYLEILPFKSILSPFKIDKSSE